MRHAHGRRGGAAGRQRAALRERSSGSGGAAESPPGGAGRPRAVRRDPPRAAPGAPGTARNRRESPRAPCRQPREPLGPCPGSGGPPHLPGTRRGRDGRRQLLRPKYGHRRRQNAGADAAQPWAPTPSKRARRRHRTERTGPGFGAATQAAHRAAPPRRGVLALGPARRRRGPLARRGAWPTGRGRGRQPCLQRAIG